MSLTDLCRQIQCGALAQSEVSSDVLLACSAAGFVGVKGCADADCSPYRSQMAARGVCPTAVVEQAPVERDEEVLAIVPSTYTPPVVAVSGEPEVVDVEAVEIRDGGGPVVVGRTPGYCRLARWADDNQVLAMGLVAGVLVLALNWKGGKP
jgi:hypothetical protein